MALPVFRAASAKAAGTTGATGVSLPTGVTAGDIVILCATTIAGGSITISTAGSITTWTEITSSGLDVASGEKLYVWWGRYTSGSTGPSVTPGGDHVCAGTVAYSGCVPNGSPIGVSTTSTEITSDTSFSFATGLTTGENDCMCICVCSHGADSNTATVGNMTNTSLTSLANRQDFCTNSGGGGGFSLQQGAKVTAGTMGTFASTLSASSPKAYIAFSLRPVVAVSVTAGVGAVTLTGISGAANVTSNQTVSSNVGVVTLTGISPQVNLKINAGLGDLSITGFIPTVTVASVGVSVDTQLGSALVNGLAPQVNLTITSGVGSLTSTGISPVISVSDNKTVLAGVGSVSADSFAPQTNLTIRADIGSVTILGLTPTVTVSSSQSANPSVGVLTLTGLSPVVTVSDNITVSLNTGQVSATGFSPTINISVQASTNTGSVLINGFSPVINLTENVWVVTQSGELILEGFEPTTGGSISVDTELGELVLVGYSPEISKRPRLSQITIKRKYWNV